MICAVESDFLHGLELFILDHLSFLDLASDVVEVSDFQFVCDSFLVLLAVKDSGENL